jgi:hypothetical protein
VPASLFVDESKANGFRFAIAQIENDEVETVRRAVKRIAAPHARRFHSTHESTAAKRRALDVVARLPITFAVVEVLSTRPWPGPREDGVAWVMTHAATAGAARVVFERDDANLARDRRAATAALVLVPDDRRPAFVHLRAHEEPLLWIPDLIVWAWSKPTTWRHSLEQRGICVEVLRVP